MAWGDEKVEETAGDSQDGAGVVLPPEAKDEKALDAFRELDPDVAAQRFLDLEARVSVLEAKTNRPH